jgi:6,7-dimethyl-8-ribityllumazine synthase
VLSRFNAAIGEGLLAGALRALREGGVADADITVCKRSGRAGIPLALQQLAQTDDYDALIALGAVYSRGETYHFEVVSQRVGRRSVERRARIRHPDRKLHPDVRERCAGGSPRMDAKGFEAAQAALETWPTCSRHSTMIDP